MGKAVLLALAASFCTATSSVCQRSGAARAPDGEQFSWRLMRYLVRQPIWLAGIASMMAGFVFQVTALHFGSLALVQPILASELLFVFGFVALGSRRVRRRDWLAAAAMAAGLGVFLFTAAPSGGHLHAPALPWWLAGGSALGLVVLVTAAAYVPLRRGRPASPGRRAATLGVATGVSWGFVAAVIKELSSHTSAGVTAIFSNWSPYVLVIAGAASLLLASHALQAGPLPASQPGFTIVDPLVASVLGVTIFGDHLALDAGDLVAEIAAGAALIVGVIMLSRSQLVHGERQPEPEIPAAGDPSAAQR